MSISVAAHVNHPSNLRDAKSLREVLKNEAERIVKGTFQVPDQIVAEVMELAFSINAVNSALLRRSYLEKMSAKQLKCLQDVMNAMESNYTNGVAISTVRLLISKILVQRINKM